MDDWDDKPELSGRSATPGLPTPASSPLPAWLDTSRPMTERKATLRAAMQPAHPQQAANILGLLASRYPVSSTTDAATLALQSKLLADDLNDLPANVLRDACREAARTCRFMPLAAEIIAFAKPAMDKLRDELAHLEAIESLDRPRAAPQPYRPDYARVADNTDALAEMRALFDAADARDGIGRAAVDYATGPLAVAAPAHSDASPALKALASRTAA